MSIVKKLGIFVLTLCFGSLVVWSNTQGASESTGLKSETEAIYKVVTASDVKWQQLNPLRGDKSPQAGTLWGNRIGPGPAGFLLKPIDGFRSPPHIHNIAYRGVVIRGLIHNDDPGAEDMWMPTGSFWTQPAGEVHITAAKGSDTLAYIEVEDGFGVLPAKDAFQDKERPINVDVSNLIWVNHPEITASPNGAKVAFLWGQPLEAQLIGTFIKLPVGFTGKIHSQNSIFRAITIQGQLKHMVPNETNSKMLEPGSYFGSKGEAVHQVSCDAGAECVLYVRTKSKFEVRAS